MESSPSSSIVYVPVMKKLPPLEKWSRCLWSYVPDRQEKVGCFEMCKLDPETLTASVVEGGTLRFGSRRPLLDTTSTTTSSSWSSGRWDRVSFVASGPLIYLLFRVTPPNYDFLPLPNHDDIIEDFNFMWWDTTRPEDGWVKGPSPTIVGDEYGPFPVAFHGKIYVFSDKEQCVWAEVFDHQIGQWEVLQEPLSLSGGEPIDMIEKERVIVDHKGDRILMGCYRSHMVYAYNPDISSSIQEVAGPSIYGWRAASSVIIDGVSYFCDWQSYLPETLFAYDMVEEQGLTVDWSESTLDQACWCLPDYRSLSLFKGDSDGCMCMIMSYNEPSDSGMVFGFHCIKFRVCKEPREKKIFVIGASVCSISLFQGEGFVQDWVALR